MRDTEQLGPDFSPPAVVRQRTPETYLWNKMGWMTPGRPDLVPEVALVVPPELNQVYLSRSIAKLW